MKKYKVNIRGIEHSMQLSDEDAKRLGAVEIKPTSKPAVKKAAPANKGVKPANK